MASPYTSCLAKTRPLLLVCLLLGPPGTAALALGPKIVRVYPLGGQAGTSIPVEILGESLANASSVEFDCQDLAWSKTTSVSTAKLAGVISVSPHAAIGPHMLRAVTSDGYSTSAIFNVSRFPSVLEAEPNDIPGGAQQVRSLPVEIQGRLDGAADIDIFAVRVRAGERWLFDLRSIEQGSSVEARMYLLDADGKRVEFNDDRAEFDENPLIEHRFEKGGLYYVKLDQYRGPRGFNFGKNCSYTLRISALPAVRTIAPLGARRGTTARFRLQGTALDLVRDIYLTELRRAEYARMTYPYTMPIHFRSDPPTAAQVARIAGSVVRRSADVIDARFTIPSAVRPGLWRLWAAGKSGIADGPTVEISDWREYDEATAAQADWRNGSYVINGGLDRAGERDVFPIQARAGQPLHFWTIAAQIGVPHLDSVLELRDAGGKKLAENDDVVAGQGTLIGNPDSSLFYTPKQDGLLYLAVADRLKRGGVGFQYRLKVASDRPGFQLFTTPENFAVERGGSAQIKVHLVREAGFAGEVSVWFEGMPPGVEAPRGKFRADQLFEPNADGADMIIPEIAFRINMPATLAAGTYPIRVRGVATAEESSPDKRIVEAHTAMIMGPLLDLWNFVRRPLPNIAVTVCEPFAARLVSHTKALSLEPGKNATLEFGAEELPESTPLEMRDLPAGVGWRLLGRNKNQITVMLEARPDAATGSFDVSAQARVGDRWAASEPIALSIQQNRRAVNRRQP